MTEPTRTRAEIPRRLAVAAELPRAAVGPVWTGSWDGLEGSGDYPFWSNGGTSRHDPDRLRPLRFEVNAPGSDGILKRVSMVGIFALHADNASETTGTLGALVQFLLGKELVSRFNFVNGQEYRDATDLTPIVWAPGNGLSIQTIGQVQYMGVDYRVDLATLDVPDRRSVDRLQFADLGSPASFLIFDIFFEYQLSATCPFRGQGGGVSLSDLGAIVRMGDRQRYLRALDQLSDSIDKAVDLEEARGQALTFVTIVAAATLELGGPRSMATLSIEAARDLTKANSHEEVKATANQFLHRAIGAGMRFSSSPSDALIDRALSVVERNFARRLTDESVAEELGLSTSHFRFLFREATGQPFHKYLVSMRLERARQLLLDGDLTVSDVAHAVGFTGLSHFSRAFSSRFHIAPTSLRRPSHDKTP